MCAVFKDTGTGLLEVLAPRVSMESTARGPLKLVIVVTSNAPPMWENEVRFIKAFTKIEFNDSMD